MTKPKPKELHKKPGPKGPWKWTEEEALKVGYELLEWMEASEDNLFFQEFLVTKKGLYRDLVADLSGYYPEFARIVKKAKELQEFRLVRLAAKQKINPVFTIFLLKNHHNYEDKKTVESTNVNLNIEDRKKLQNLDPADLKERIRLLTEEKAAN